MVCDNDQEEYMYEDINDVYMKRNDKNYARLAWRGMHRMSVTRSG